MTDRIRGVLCHSACSWHCLHHRAYLTHSSLTVGQRPSSYVASANSFMELRHYPRSLISTHACQDWVREPVSEHCSIHEGVPRGISLYLLAFSRLCWEDPIRDVAPIGRHPRVPFFQDAQLHGVLPFWRSRVNTYTGGPRRVLNQGPMTPRPSLKLTNLKDVHLVIRHKRSRRFEDLLDDRPLPSPLA